MKNTILRSYSKSIVTALITTLLLVTAGCNWWPLKTTENTIIPLSIQQVADEIWFDVEVADTPDKRAQGLMHREWLDEEEGMLFVFDEVQTITMWMKNTLIPLDMLFLDENKEIVFIFHEVQPCTSEPCFRYTSPYQAKYVVELAGGVADKREITLGDKVEFNLP